MGDQACESLEREYLEMTTTHAFRQALHIPWTDPDINEIVGAVVPGVEYSTDWILAAGTPEAPVDGKQYGRQASGWTEVTWSSVTGKPSTFPPSAHNHPWSDITGKPLTFPPDPHTHAQAEVTGLIADLSARVLKAGDVMAGHLGLPTGPSASQAVRRDYVDSAVAGITGLGDAPNDGKLYARQSAVWIEVYIDCGTY
jgi:hypothetical protein